MKRYLKAPADLATAKVKLEFERRLGPVNAFGCQLWRGAKKNDGRPTFMTFSAQRVAWFYRTGEMPPYSITPSCENKLCISHLIAGKKSPPVPRKLTASQVEEIRKSYRLGGETYRTLAARYGVSAVMIGRIINGIAWRA